MRIAMVAPPWFEIPPPGYGGIESMCHSLVEGLLKRGHEVMLVAAGDSSTSGELVQTFSETPTGLGQASGAITDLLHAAKATGATETMDADIVHDHSSAGPLAARGRRQPTVVTAHGPVEGEIGDFFRNLENVGFVAISDAQRRNAPDLPWVGTVYNGIAVDEYPFRADKEDFVLFLGRLSPEKGAHIAIEAAREAGYPLVLAGKCSEDAERNYFENQVAPRLDSDVDWIGQADSKKKKDLLSRARCLVFPIQWQEPFGLVMVEALACGTPVVALNGGSVPEVVVDQKTGFICEQESELAPAIDKVDTIDPEACRDRAHKFDIEAMVGGYEAVYKKVLAGKVSVG